MADIFIVGGGINGTGVARDAAGRGLKVILAEKDDLASHTSSASSKLIHGGLRYLEHYEFRLVRESLMEREVLLKSAPHLITPMRFILPHHKALRPAWILRLGLFLYDHIGGRELLPPTSTLKLQSHKAGIPLNETFVKGFEYSDCWVDDARLVVLAAKDAEGRGANILTRTKVIKATRKDGVWDIETTGGTFKSKALVNASGPWVDKTEDFVKPAPDSRKNVRMVKGSHIIVPKLYEGEQAYTFQNEDGRVVFAIPYENDFTVIGTTDVPIKGDPGNVSIDDAEKAYLCKLASQYFKTDIETSDIVWSFSGVRPLVDDGTSNASKATRDYVLELDLQEAPMLSIYGGKITTFRRLAEEVMEKLQPHLAYSPKNWTAGSPLPGGAMGYSGLQDFRTSMATIYNWLEPTILDRLIKAYGTHITYVLGDATSVSELGQHFGAGLYEAEVKYLMQEEWAKTAEDILWRRTKIGLHMTAEKRQSFENWLSNA